MSRKTFQNVIVFLLLLPFSRAAVVYKRYAVKQEYQNKLFSSSQMVEMYSESLIQCAIQCMNKYSCFGFNDLKHTSRVYEVTISIQSLNGILAGYIILQVSPHTLRLGMKIVMSYTMTDILNPVSIHFILGVFLTQTIEQYECIVTWRRQTADGQ